MNFLKTSDLPPRQLTSKIRFLPEIVDLLRIDAELNIWAIFFFVAEYPPGKTFFYCDYANKYSTFYESSSITAFIIIYYCFFICSIFTT